jgi:trans-AT polyketide synthase/acyltransferase/oxidoreductase domain-containing protein
MHDHAQLADVVRLDGAPMHQRPSQAAPRTVSLASAVFSSSRWAALAVACRSSALAASGAAAAPPPAAALTSSLPAASPALLLTPASASASASAPAPAPAPASALSAGALPRANTAAFAAMQETQGGGSRPSNTER